ncbi:MAG: glycosyltransferase [Paracoccaceae bacterium]
MRILYYNWIDYLDEEHRGGGVSLYQRNVMESFGDEAVFLSSGLSFDLLRRKPRWQTVSHGPDENRERRYEIINSGVMAPAHHSFGENTQLSHTPTTDAFADFLAATGPYDVIHFNNLEGLPAEALRTARACGAQVVFSLHNYYPLCPQVNLWRQERVTCVDFENGQACIDCIESKHPAHHLKIANGLAWHLKSAGLRPGEERFDFIFKNAMRVGRRLPRRKHNPKNARHAKAPDGSRFADRRTVFVDLINEACDKVLCVSDAVRKVAQSYGMSGDILQTDYIGTRQSEMYHRTQPRDRISGQLTLAYLGYMRRDKGFFFLLSALETLPDPVLAQLNFVLAAGSVDGETMHRIEVLGQRLSSLKYFDGYGHGDLDHILEKVDVGVIPVLWHDNLPQVAIEIHARKIPLLTADMGGAQELGNYPEMVFKAGDANAFHAKIEALLNENIDMDAYWQNARAPINVETHIDNLKAIYSDLLSKRAATKGAEYQGTETVGS